MDFYTYRHSITSEKNKSKAHKLYNIAIEYFKEDRELEYELIFLKANLYISTNEINKSIKTFDKGIINDDDISHRLIFFRFLHKLHYIEMTKEEIKEDLKLLSNTEYYTWLKKIIDSFSENNVRKYRSAILRINAQYYEIDILNLILTDIQKV